MTNNIFKQSAILLKNNIMVIQPLFFAVLVIFLAVIPITAKATFDFASIASIIIAIFCCTAFLSGWYNCVKYTVSLKNREYASPEERNQFQIEILKQFFPGVTEYILSVTAVGIIYVLIGYGLFELYRIFAVKIYVANNLPSDFLQVLNNATQAELTQYFQTNLSVEQLKILVLLFLGGFIIYYIFQVLVLWFAPAILYSSKNPFIAVFEGIKFSFKHLPVSILIIFIMFLINMFISFTNTLLNNQFLAFIPMLLTFFYIMYYVLTVFLYYESKAQNNCDNGCKCNG